MKNFVIIMFMIIIVPLNLLNGTILSRSTFETWEGTLSETGWVITISSNGDVRKDLEDPTNPDYQKQAHGELSLRIYDPDNSSYANAYKTFSNTSSEYMTEFYLWIYHTHAHIDSFPLCVLLYKPSEEDTSYRTDIALVLDTLEMVPNHHPYVIRVEDANGFHTACYIDSTDRWYKLQIYRHPNFPNPAVVDFYVDGDSIGTYSPMNSGYKTNKISFGTTESDSLSDGEVFYDDVIVTTPPVGEHPRLVFTEDDIPILQARAEDTTPLPTGHTYKYYADGIKNAAYNYATSDTIITVKGQFGETYELNHPYHYPTFFFHTNPGDVVVWRRLASVISWRLQRLALSSVLEPDSIIYVEKTKEILLSLAQWLQWTNPDLEHGNYNNYCFLETWNLIHSSSLAYDMIFNHLTTHEKMCIQNAILTLGVEQLYLESLYGYTGSDLGRSPTSRGGVWPNHYAFFNSGLGLGALTVFDNESQELDTARSRIDTLFSTCRVSDQNGGWIEGFAYSHFSLLPTTIFCTADSIAGGNSALFGNHYLKESCYFHLYLILPGDSVEVNFGDARFHYRTSAYPSLLASRYSDEFIQYYLAKTYFNDPILTFLWIDASVDTLNPEGYLSPGREFPDIGWAIFRTGWDADDYLLAMKSGPGAGHTQCDNNTIVFGTNGKWLITDAGYAYPDTTKKWPLNHNVVIINGDTVNSQVNYYSESNDLPGKITKFYVPDDARYGFFEGDASLPYYNYLSKYLRKVVMLNDNSPFFVMQDKFLANNTTTLNWVDWLLHTWGDIDTIANRISISDDSECLDVKILFPDSIEIKSRAVYENEDSVRTRVYVRKNYTPEDTTNHYFLSVFFPYNEGQTHPAINKIAGAGIMGAQVANGVVIFGKDDIVKGASYVINVPAGGSVFNVLADLYVSEEEPVVYTIIDENLDAGTRQDTSITPTEAGTMSFKVSGQGKHRITVFVPGKIESSSDDATAQNSSKRFFYDDSLNKFHLLYKDSDMIMHGVRFLNIDGWVEGYRIGDGMHPTLASFTDTTGEVILGAVWVNSKVVYFSRYTYASGWSTPCSLVSYSGSHTPHYFPPSLAIDDSGTAHLAWGIVLVSTSEPCTVTSVLRYSTFDAGLKEPMLSDTVTLDSVIKPSSSSWSMGYASLDLYNDTISVVVWSRPIGAGKDTIYCKQETSSGWPSSPEVVSLSSSKASNPFCDIKGSMIHVVWEEEGVIKYRQRYITTDWMSIETVSNTLLTSRNPQIVNGDICVYTEVPQLQPNHRSHVVYRKRSEQETWGSSNILESTSYESEYPQSYFLKEALHAVWTEGNNAPYEVKYKKKSEP